MTCSTKINDPDRCPGTDEILDQLLASLPRGRAWGGVSGPQPDSTLWKYWRAVASVFADLEARICALREEFWCATESETDDLWMAEYGLPDACDPYPDLCAKVAAIGSGRCAYFRAVAFRAGWVITCNEVLGDCGGWANSMVADADTAASTPVMATLEIVVNLAASPALAGVYVTDSLADLLMADEQISCGIDLSGLKCLMDRLVPAHVRVNYATI